MNKSFLYDYKSIINENASLIKTLSNHDPISAVHSINVCALVDQFVRPFCGPENHYLVTTAALLHDIGKICIPESILQKADKLTSEEREIIEQHPEHGAKILTDHNYSQLIIDAALQHHMRADGKGYPQLPFVYQNDFAKIIAITDAYEAMIYPRCYKQQMDPLQALFEIQRGADSGQFDPYVAKQFVNFETKRLVA